MSSIIAATILTILTGCATPDIDRGLVNDPLMQVSQGGIASEVSPFSGLKNRNKVSGGNSCSTCAH